MWDTLLKSEKMKKDTDRFYNELKMFVNQRLFDKELISEEMYWSVKEVLIKQSN